MSTLTLLFDHNGPFDHGREKSPNFPEASLPNMGIAREILIKEIP